MLKTLLLVLAGSVAGVAIALWLRSSPEPIAAEPAPASVSVTPLVGIDAAAARLRAVEDALDAEILQRAVLEERVAELAAELEALGEGQRLARRSDAANGSPPVDGGRDIRARQTVRSGVQRAEGNTVEQLIAAGFAPDRAAWIDRRTQELRMQLMQAQYEARRDGRPPPADAEATTLRAELGDQDYERFLTATGRSTAVNIMGVLASSPAERAGLQQGDEIVAYDGKRVFDVTELNELTLGGASGESVVVDVRRDGQNLQIVMPRGPLGVWGGFRGPSVPVQR
jgi:S1-C subfamily serine protease